MFTVVCNKQRSVKVGVGGSAECHKRVPCWLEGAEQHIPCRSAVKEYFILCQLHGA